MPDEQAFEASDDDGSSAATSASARDWAADPGASIGAAAHAPDPHDQLLLALAGIQAALDVTSDATTTAGLSTDPSLRAAVAQAWALSQSVQATYLTLLQALDSRAGSVTGHAVDAQGQVLARQALHRTPKAARADVRAAHALRPDADPCTGGLPELGQAFTAGEISREHVDVALDIVARIPVEILSEPIPADATGAPAADRPAPVMVAAGLMVDQFLTAKAREHDPAVLRRLGMHLLAVLLPERDGFDPESHTRRGLDYATDSFDSRRGTPGSGMLTGRFALDAAAGATVMAAIEHFSKPDPTRTETAEDGSEHLVRDTRTAAQRRADALEHVCALALGAPEAGTRGGERPRIVIHAGLDDVRQALHDQAAAQSNGTAQPSPTGQSRPTGPGQATGQGGPPQQPGRQQPGRQQPEPDQPEQPEQSQPEQSGRRHQPEAQLPNDLAPQETHEQHADGAPPTGRPRPPLPTPPQPFPRPRPPQAPPPESPTPSPPPPPLPDQWPPPSPLNGRRGITLEQTGPVGARLFARLACDSTLERALRAANGAVLDLGRDVRTITPAQRRALIARDRGCVIPGCTTPAAWCHGHHVTFWSNGGLTNLDALALVCPRHHTEIHLETGWTLEMHHGLPWARPPRWLEPTRPLLRNTIHTDTDHAHRLGEQLRLQADPPTEEGCDDPHR